MANQAEIGSGIRILTLAHTAELAAIEYVKDPSSPERYYNHQQARWALNGHAAGLAPSDLVVSPVPWTEDQMRKFMGKGLRGLMTRLTHGQDIPFYLPEVVSERDGFSLLTKAYPWLGWNDVNMVGVQNKVDVGGVPFGHLRTEAAIDAPHTGTNEDQAAEILVKVKLDRRGHTLNTYAVAGNESRLLLGKYLDQDGTFTRVMSSRVGGRVVDADFFPDGFCYVGWYLGPDDADGRLGVRSVGV